MCLLKKSLAWCGERVITGKYVQEQRTEMLARSNPQFPWDEDFSTASLSSGAILVSSLSGADVHVRHSLSSDMKHELREGKSILIKTK